MGIMIDLAYRRRNLLDLRLGAEQNRVVQDDHAMMSSFRLGQVAGRAQTTGRTADVQSAKALIESDALGAHGGNKTVTRQAEAACVKLKTKLVVPWLGIQVSIVKWATAR